MSQRLRRRYIAVKVNTEQHLDRKDVFHAVFNSLLKLFGEYGASLAELVLIDYDEKNSVAIFRCVHKALEMVKASIIAVTAINGNNAAIQILCVSGTIKALRKKLTA